MCWPRAHERGARVVRRDELEPRQQRRHLAYCLPDILRRQIYDGEVHAAHRTARSHVCTTHPFLSTARRQVSPMRRSSVLSTSPCSREPDTYARISPSARTRERCLFWCSIQHMPACVLREQVRSISQSQVNIRTRCLRPSALPSSWATGASARRPTSRSQRARARCARATEHAFSCHRVHRSQPSTGIIFAVLFASQ